MHNNQIQQDLELAFEGGDGQEVQTSEEAHFYHTLKEFEDIVRRVGGDKVLMEMGDDCFWVLFKWFHSAD